MQDFIIELGSNLWSSCLSLSSTGVMGVLLGLPFLCLTSDDSCCFILGTACAGLLSGTADNLITRYTHGFPSLNYLVFQQRPSSGHKAIFLNGNWIASNAQGRGEAMSVWIQIIPGGPLCPHLQAKTCCLVSRWLLPGPISLSFSSAAVGLGPRPSSPGLVLSFWATSPVLL